MSYRRFVRRHYAMETGTSAHKIDRWIKSYYYSQHGKNIYLAIDWNEF